MSHDQLVFTYALLLFALWFLFGFGAGFLIGRFTQRKVKDKDSEQE